MFEVGSRVLYHAHDRLDFNATTCCGLSNSYHHCMYWWMRIHLVWRENFLIEKSSGQQRGNVSWRRLGCFNQFEESPTCSSEYGCQSTSVFLRVHLSLNWANCATEHREETLDEATQSRGTRTKCLEVERFHATRLSDSRLHDSRLSDSRLSN